MQSSFHLLVSILYLTSKLFSVSLNLLSTTKYIKSMYLVTHILQAILASYMSGSTSKFVSFFIQGFDYSSIPPLITTVVNLSSINLICSGILVLSSSFLVGLVHHSSVCSVEPPSILLLSALTNSTVCPNLFFCLPVGSS